MSRGHPARLPRWQKRLLIVSGAALWASGIAWLVLHHFGQVNGPFGPERNPLEAWMLRLHGLFLIPFLLGIGGLFVAHIPRGWSRKPNRLAGIALTAFLGLLVLSGYMLYYVGTDEIRAWTGTAHWALGLTLPALFLWHYRQRTSGRRGDRPA
jgi:hypothetical protein